MLTTDANSKLYELSLSQREVYHQQQYCLFKEVLNIAVCIYINKQLDYDIFKKAVNKEIERNDCLRLFFKKHKGKIMQYFAEPYEKNDIPEVDFSNKTYTEQHEFLLKDARTPIRFKSQNIFRIMLIRSYDGKCGIYFAICHLNMDAVSVLMCLDDLLKVYKALVNNTGMPEPFVPYINYMESEKKYFDDIEKIKRDEQFYRDLLTKNGEPMFNSLSGPDMLEKMKKKRRNPNLRSYPIINILKMKSANIKRHIDYEFVKEMKSFCDKYNVSPFSMIQLAARTYISKINNGEEDVFYGVVCTRRPTLDDKRTSGTMADMVTVRTIISADTRFRDAVMHTGEAMIQSFRHANFDSTKTFTLTQQIYKLGVFDGYYSMMFSYLPVMPQEGWECDAEWISNGRFEMPLYIVIAYSLTDGGYDIYYEYNTHVYNHSHAEALHQGIIDILKTGLQNPDMTVGEIMNII